MGTENARTIQDLPEWFNAADDLLGPNLVAHPNKAAVIDCDGVCSYDELAGRVARMAGVFEALGVHRDQRVLVCLTDTRDFPSVFLGAIRAGVIPIPLNTLLTCEDYAWILHNSDAAAVFVSGALTDKWREIAAAKPRISFVSSTRGARPKKIFGSPFALRDATWSDLETLQLRAAPRAEAAHTHRDDVAFWLYTSARPAGPKARCTCIALCGSLPVYTRSARLG